MFRHRSVIDLSRAESEIVTRLALLCCPGVVRNEAAMELWSDTIC